MQLSITSRHGGGRWDTSFSRLAMVPSLMTLCLCLHYYQVSSRCPLLATSSVLWPWPLFSWPIRTQGRFRAAGFPPKLNNSVILNSPGMWGHGIKVESSSSISFLCFRSDPNKQISFSYLKKYKSGHLSVSHTHAPLSDCRLARH